MTIKVIVHDLMVGLRPKGVGGGHLRWSLWVRLLEICHQSSINGPNVGGMVEFKFKMCDKLQMVFQQKTLGNLRTELLRARVLMN